MLDVLMSAVRVWRRQRRLLVVAASNNGTSAPQSKLQRGVVILPGLGNSAADYHDIASDLEARNPAALVLFSWRVEAIAVQRRLSETAPSSPHANAGECNH